MIENPFPESWQELQRGVCQILNDIGLSAEVGRSFVTPRGKVEIDVFAVDEKNVDKIRYVIECKNWKSPVPQSVVHSFTTVMHEVGGNIGFIISREGLQPGAISYTTNTNIIGLTYREFQERFFGLWFEKYFVTAIGNIAEPLVVYTEQFEPTRDKALSDLPKDKQEMFWILCKKYINFSATVSFFEFPRYSSFCNQKVPDNIYDFKADMLARTNGVLDLKSIYFRDALDEFVNTINSVTQEFNDIFGGNIFESS